MCKFKEIKCLLNITKQIAECVYFCLQILLLNAYNIFFVIHKDVHTNHTNMYSYNMLNIIIMVCSSHRPSCCYQRHTHEPVRPIWRDGSQNDRLLSNAFEIHVILFVCYLMSCYVMFNPEKRKRC